MKPPGTLPPLQSILKERRRNRKRWGKQDYPDGTGGDYAAGLARFWCDKKTSLGTVTFVDVLREEVAEAFEETDPTRLRAELVQVAAVCVAWIEAIDRRGAKQ